MTRIFLVKNYEDSFFYSTEEDAVYAQNNMSGECRLFYENIVANSKDMLYRCGEMEFRNPLHRQKHLSMTSIKWLEFYSIKARLESLGIGFDYSYKTGDLTFHNEGDYAVFILHMSHLIFDFKKLAEKIEGSRTVRNFGNLKSVGTWIP